VTADGAEDWEIQPHKVIKGKLWDELQGLIGFEVLLEEDNERECGSESETESEHESEDGDGSDGDGNDDMEDNEGWDSEDNDDVLRAADDDGDQELIPPGMELQLPDEAEEADDDGHAQIQAARVSAVKGGDEGQHRAFNLANRIAQQDSVAVPPLFTGAVDVKYNVRKKATFKTRLIEYEATRGGKPATQIQAERI
jgi:hypothetical protein